jgi:transposase
MPERLRPAEPDAIAPKALSTRRRQLTELVAMEKTRLAQAFDESIAASHRAAIAALEAACAELERRLEATIAADPRLARKRQILVSIPGIAGRVAGVVIADTPELGARKAAASSPAWRRIPTRAAPCRGGTPSRAGGRACAPPVSHGRHGRRALPSALQGRLPGHARRREAPKGAVVATGRRLVTIANALIRDDITFHQSRFAS